MGYIYTKGFFIYLFFFPVEETSERFDQLNSFFKFLVPWHKTSSGCEARVPGCEARGCLPWFEEMSELLEWWQWESCRKS